MRTLYAGCPLCAGVSVELGTAPCTHHPFVSFAIADRFRLGMEIVARKRAKGLGVSA